MKNKEKKDEERCICPFCDDEIIVSASPICQSCDIVFLYCRKCQITVLDREATHCPKCGEPLT